MRRYMILYEIKEMILIQLNRASDGGQGAYSDILSTVQFRGCDTEPLDKSQES